MPPSYVEIAKHDSKMINLLTCGSLFSKKTYETSFKDLGTTIEDLTLSSGEERNLLLIYKVSEKEEINRFVLYYQELNGNNKHLRKIKLKLNGQEISGYVNGSKLDKEGIYELEAIDMAGNSSKIKFYIIKNGYQIRNDNNIININIDTSVEMFKEKFKVFDQYLIKHEDKEMDDNYNIATGDELENNNGEKFILIVRGDINQDGKFTLSDVSLLKKCYLEIINLNDTQKLAADMNLDGEISLSDVSLIKKKFVGFEKE